MYQAKLKELTLKKKINFHILQIKEYKERKGRSYLHLFAHMLACSFLLSSHLPTYFQNHQSSSSDSSSVPSLVAQLICSICPRITWEGDWLIPSLIKLNRVFFFIFRRSLAPEWRKIGMWEIIAWNLQWSYQTVSSAQHIAAESHRPSQPSPLIRVDWNRMITKCYLIISLPLRRGGYLRITAAMYFTCIFSA